MSSDQMIDYLFLNGESRKVYKQLFLLRWLAVSRWYYRAVFLTIYVVGPIEKLRRAMVPLSKKVYGHVKFCT